MFATGDDGPNERPTAAGSCKASIRKGRCSRWRRRSA